MTWYSLTFLFIFLPAGLFLCALTRGRMQNVTLLILSLLFYALLDAGSLPLLLGLLLIDYGTGLLLARIGERHRFLARLTAGISVLKTLCLVFYCLMRVQTEGAPLPAGLLIWGLSSLGYVVDVYRGENAERSPVRFFLCFCFFGRVVLGPYVDSGVLRAQLRTRKLSFASISTGLVLFIRGVAKRVVLADTLLEAWRRIAEIPPRERTTLSAWLLLISFAMGVVFFLSAYCDCARGLGLIFSVKLPRNMMNPFYVHSVREFIARFQITLGAYLRRYVYRSLGGAEYGFLSDACNTVLWLMLYGAWFGLRPNCVIWGMALAVLALGEKYVYGRLLSRLPALFGRVYALLAVLLSFTLLSQNSLDASRQMFSLLFTFQSQMLMNDQIVYILSQYAWALVLGAFLSVPVLPHLAGWCKRRLPALAGFGTLAANIVLLGVSCMMLLAK